MEREHVPEGEAIFVQVGFTDQEMMQSRNFELLVDCRLAAVKVRVMQAYRDRKLPPAWFDAALEGKP